MYTFGAILAVIGISTCVSPFLVSAHNVSTTCEPFSREIKARPPSLDGKETVAFSPTLYFSLLEEKTSIFASAPVEFLVFPDQIGQSIITVSPAECPPFGSVTLTR
ncbi:hypothetical protein D9M69_539990 [compost metagenome]